MVERRREQAAEESRKALAGYWMNSSVSRFAPNVLSCHSRLLAGGNVLSKPLDSGLRRNDGGVAAGFCCHDERAASGFYPNDEGGLGQAFVSHGKGAVGLATSLFSLRCHSGEGRNPGRRWRDVG